MSLVWDEWLQACVKRIEACLPAGSLQMKQDLQKNLLAVLKESLSRLDVVSREEFDAQRHVLERSQQTLRQLEQRLRDLEQNIKPSSE